MAIFKKAFILTLAISLGATLGFGLAFVLCMVIAASLEELISRL